MAWNTSTVTIGAPTRKSDYDRLRLNDMEIASGSFTFNGTKTFAGSVALTGAASAKHFTATSLTLKGAASPFYDPLGDGTLGTPKPTALTTGDLNPANTNVTVCTTFAGLPANCYVFCAVQIRTTSGTVRSLKIWQDAGGTIPGVGTSAIGALLNTNNDVSSFTGHYMIKLDASGNFYWQVSNADVDILRFTSIIYFI